jgi:hypothetical protein
MSCPEPADDNSAAMKLTIESNITPRQSNLLTLVFWVVLLAVLGGFYLLFRHTGLFF